MIRGDMKINKIIFSTAIATVVLTVASFASVTHSAHADDDGIIDITVSPTQGVTSTITVNGSGQGGTIVQDCGPRIDSKDSPKPILAMYYYFDGNSASSTFLNYPSEWNQTYQGQISCDGNPPYRADEYSIGFDADVSSLSPGTHTITVAGSGHPPIDSGEGTFVINGSGSGGNTTGTINVSSINAVTNGSVQASWDFTGQPFQGQFVDPCSEGVCNNTSSATYSNANFGIYELNPSSIPDHYALQSVRKSTVAQTSYPDIAFINRFINTAQAVEICGFANGGSEQCDNGSSPSLTLATSAGYPVNPDISFTLEWTPLGTIDPGQPPVLSPSNTTGDISLADSNGAPGSQVTDLSAGPVTYGNGASNWLTIGDLSGITLTYGGQTQSVGVTADQNQARNCPSVCTATFTISGWTPSASATGTQVTSGDIVVTYNSSGNGNGNYTVSINPSSSTLLTGGVQQFTASTTDPAGVTWTNSGLGTLSNPTALSVTYTAPPNPGSDAVTATNNTGGQTATAPITINQPQSKPTVNLSVSPSAINSGEQATLSWTTTNADSCTASSSPQDQGWLPGTPEATANNGTSTATVSPTGPAFENYSLTCRNPKGHTVATTVLNVMTCSLIPNPSSVIVPGTSTLNFDCEAIPNTYSCLLFDQNNVQYGTYQPQGGTVKGFYTVAPTANTTYTIDCTDNGGGNGPQASATTQVSVTNPGQGECPPQGCTP